MKRTRVTLSLAAIALTATALFAFSGTQSALPEATQATPETIPGHAALRATINPETGAVEVSTKVPSSLALDPATAHALRRDSEGLKPITRPDGSVYVHLDGRFQSASVARIDENGKVLICSEHADAVEGMLHKHDSAPKAPEVK